MIVNKPADGSNLVGRENESDCTMTDFKRACTILLNCLFVSDFFSVMLTSSYLASAI